MYRNSSYLVKHIFVNDFINITVEKELELVSVTWQRPVSSEELKQGFYLAVEAAIMYGCRYWLSDARQGFYVGRRELHWLVWELVPLLRLTEVQKLARVVPDEERALWYSAYIKDKVEKELGQQVSFRAGIFTDKAAAQQWLLKPD